MLDVAVGILVNAQTQVLMATRAPHKKDGHLLEFPGGKQDPGETPREALARELKEELAVEISLQSTKQLGVYEHDYGYSQVRAHTFVVREWTGTPNPQEGQKVLWCNLEAIDLEACLALVAPILHDLKRFL